MAPRPRSSGPAPLLPKPQHRGPAPAGRGAIQFRLAEQQGGAGPPTVLRQGSGWGHPGRGSARRGGVAIRSQRPGRTQRAVHRRGRRIVGFFLGRHSGGWVASIAAWGGHRAAGAYRSAFGGGHLAAGKRGACRPSGWPPGRKNSKSCSSATAPYPAGAVFPRAGAARSRREPGPPRRPSWASAPIGGSRSQAPRPPSPPSPGGGVLVSVDGLRGPAPRGQWREHERQHG